MYQLEAGRVEAVQFSGLEQTWIGSREKELGIIVRPRPSSLRRLRDPRVTSRIPMPLGALQPIGLTTTDFKEIREYRDGDQFRHINWKATAKREGTMNSIPFVNDFEKEGRKTIWLFLDAREWMRTGSTIENAFEYAIQATLGISSSTCRGTATSAYPSTTVGTRYCRTPAGGSPSASHGSSSPWRPSPPRCGTDREVALAEAVESIRGHLHGISPFFIVVTMIGKDNAANLVGGIPPCGSTARGECGRRIMVLHVRGYELALAGECEKPSATLVDLETTPLVRVVRKAGAFVIPWNPASQSLMRVMTVGMKKRNQGASDR